MKRLPLILSLLAVIALSASIAYWVMELYKPKQRPMAAMAEAAQPEPAPDAAATLFGGQAVSGAPSNYQLTGVVAAGREGVAILVVEGQPPRALQVGKEVASGVTVQEVHAKYVMLSEGGVLKRIDLATDDKGGNMSLAPPTAAGRQAQDQQQSQQQQEQQQMQQMQQQMQGQQQEHQQMQQPGVPEQPPTSVPVPPSNGPMEVPAAQPPGMPPPPPPVQMPAPTRNMSGQGGQPPTQ